MALNNLASCLRDLGRREDALAAAEEAVDLCRALAAARPDAFTPDLARRSPTSPALPERSRPARGRARRRRGGRDLYRALAAARPDAFTPDLAMALNNLASRLSALGRREDALAAAEEACDLYRALAAARPDAFTPDLASALNNLAGALSAGARTRSPPPRTAWSGPADGRRAGHQSRGDHGPACAVPRTPCDIAHWMAPMCQQYIERSERLGRDPDAELLGLITEALRQMEDSSGEAEGADRLP